MDIVNSPDRSRREGVEAFSILLADGNRWGLALPSARLRPETIEGLDELGRPSTSIHLISDFGYPPGIRALIDDLKSACDQSDPVRHYDALIRLAAALLRRAHDIDEESATSLMELGVDDLGGLVEAVLFLVSGRFQPDPGQTRKVDLDG